MENFKQKMITSEWNEILSDKNPKTGFDMFDSKLNDCFNSAFPLKRVKLSKTNSPVEPCQMLYYYLEKPKTNLS